MARECHHDVALNLSATSKDANGSSAADTATTTSKNSDATATTGEPPTAIMHDESGDYPTPSQSSEGQGGEVPSSSTVEGEGGDVLPKSKSSPSSTSSSSSDSEVKGAEGGDTGPLCSIKGKDRGGSLSPERAMSVKRCLWDVDRKEVTESLSRELKRIRQEESLVKSSKWNFDFEREVPLRGSWTWKKGTDAPQFYQTKEYPSKKRHHQTRYSPYDRPPPDSTPSLPSSLPLHSSPLVTATQTTTCGSASPSIQPGQSLFTKDFFKSAIGATMAGKETTSVPTPTTAVPSTTSPGPLTVTTTCVVSTPSPSTIVTAPSSATLCVSSCTSGAEVSSSSGGGGSERQGSIPSQCYSDPSSSLSEPEDRGSGEPLSGATIRTCKSPEKKKLKPSQSTQSSSAPRSSSGSSPSPLLKYFR